ncbi:MAG: hypothetical protein ACI8U3_001691 [Brevundimonas sp.]|uniref:DUF2793 domain-containing protein n=1 Tax=Brevundimonas sp. TaxID=1871086 RepID=UPI0039E5FAB5
MIPAESQSSARLDLPYLQAGQMQKHVTLNEALTRLDALVQCAVVSRTVSEQPETPDAGALHILPEDATGDAWASMAAGALARFEAGGWTAMEPPPGLRVFVLDEQCLIVRGDEGWTDVVGTPVRLDDLEGLGVGTVSDAANAFAAKLNSALWTARTEGEGGAGDLRFVLNKESGANVLSLLFQSGWSGRAELGLVGDDDLVLKVSPDGDAWREALRVDRHSGRLGFPVMDALLRPATQNVLTAFEASPGRTRAFLIDDLIAALEAAGLWERLSALYLTAAHDEQAARLNLKAPGVFDLAPVNDPAFAAANGFTGDGAGAWLDTGLSASALADGGTGVAAGIRLTDNPSPGTSQFPVGPTDGDETLSMAISPSTGNFSARLGTTTLAMFGAAPAVTGHFCVSRTGATHVAGYHDGVPLASPASPFTGYAGGSIGLLRRLGNYHSGTVAAAWLGKDMDAGQVAALHAALASWLSETGVV